MPQELSRRCTQVVEGEGGVGPLLQPWQFAREDRDAAEDLRYAQDLHDRAEALLESPGGLISCRRGFRNT